MNSLTFFWCFYFQLETLYIILIASTCSKPKIMTWGIYIQKFVFAIDFKHDFHRNLMIDNKNAPVYFIRIT